ncbi:MAG: Rnf-Nqr domain containing protein [Pseudomonas sp.]|uniref:Rnf-Nqr domain containing protein n=1 Tax=Pseudomonas sp. TaxID=306 RepID=UPI003D0FD7A8
MSEFFFVLIGAALVNHLILSLPADAGVQRSARLRFVGPASALLILLATPLSWLLHRLLLSLDLDYLHLLLMLPLLAALAWACLAAIARWQRPDEPVNGLLPLLLGNGAGLGIMLTGTPLESFILALALGAAGGLGFWLVMQLLADLLERAAQGDVPAPFRGTPLLLVCAGLMGLAFLGLNGLGAA